MTIGKVKLKKGVQYKDTLLSREYFVEQSDLLKMLGIKGNFGHVEIHWNHEKTKLEIITDESIGEDIE